MSGDAVYLELGSGTTTFGWCDKCLLPSRVTTGIHILDKDGVSPCGTLEFCTEHGAGSD